MKYQINKDFFPDCHYVIDLAENCIRAPRLRDHNERVLKRVHDSWKNRLVSPDMRECVKGYREILGLIRKEYGRGNEALFKAEMFLEVIDIILDARTFDRWLKPDGININSRVFAHYKADLHDLAEVVRNFSPEINRLQKERSESLLRAFASFSKSA